MQTPRVLFQLRWLMVVVALVAADCFALRFLLRQGRVSALLVLALLPMLDLLLPGFLLAASQYRRRGACSAFLAGFEDFGWAGVAVFASFCLSPSAFDVVVACLNALFSRLEPLHQSWGLTYNPNSIVQEVYLTALSSAALSLPLFITDLSGGFLACASGITLARSGRAVETQRLAQGVD